jgi:hypothetical protein
LCAWSTGVPFDAPDGKPVGLIFVLLVPEAANEHHLQLLSELAQMFSDREFREQLAAVADAAGLARPLRQLARQLIVSELFERNRERLQLTWVSGPMTRAICTTEHIVSPADLIGHLNLMHPERLQVIGAPEVAWALRHSTEKVAHHMAEIYAAKPPAIIVADACDDQPRRPRRLRSVGHAAADHADVIGFRHRHPARLCFAPAGRNRHAAWRVSSTCWAWAC